MARQENTSDDCIQKRFHKSRKVFCKAASIPKIPNKVPLLAIADALHCECEKQSTVIPIILLRPVNSNRAHLYVIDAFFGGESLNNWSKAFDQIPEEIYERIVALVSDDHKSLEILAEGNGWIHQICTFHVKARFHRWLPRWKSSPSADGKRAVWKAAKNICDNKNIYKVRSSIAILKKYKRHPGFDPLLRKSIRGLIMNWNKCRVYINHPELHLPDTSNVVESVGSRVREMIANRRGFRTIKSLRNWLLLYQKVHPEITCNEAKNLHI